MHFKKISFVGEYCNWIIKKYSELKQPDNIIYRIIGLKSKQNKLIIQLVGKSLIIELSPHEIVADDKLLEGFSKKDIRAITYLACEIIKKPKYKIIMQEFSEEYSEMKFQLKEVLGKTVITKSAIQILLDKDILTNMSNDDIKSISYMAGYEYSQKNSTSC